MAKLGKRAKAKKYASLRAKQAQANKMIREARGRLKSGHNALDRLYEHKKTFYNKRGLKTVGQLSFKNLESKDLGAYEALLDSILNDTYINKEKYESHEEKMKERIKEWFNSDDVDGAVVDEFNEALEGDVFNDLLSLQLPPSELATLENEFIISGLSTEDFYNMVKGFDSKNNTINDFFVYANDYAENLLREQELKERFDREVEMGMWGADEYDLFKEEYVAHPTDDIYR